MKKKKNNNEIIILGLFTIISVFTSCSFGASRRGLPALKPQAAFITIFVQEPFNSLTAIQNRSAVPSLPENNTIEYEITATCGEKTIHQNQPVSGNNIFRLEIEPGLWEVQVTGNKSEVQSSQSSQSSQGQLNEFIIFDKAIDNIIYCLKMNVNKIQTYIYYIKIKYIRHL